MSDRQFTPIAADDYFNKEDKRPVQQAAPKSIQDFVNAQTSMTDDDIIIRHYELDQESNLNNVKAQIYNTRRQQEREKGKFYDIVDKEDLGEGDTLEERLWRMKNAEMISNYTGVSPGHIYQNYEREIGSLTGKKDAKSDFDYLADKLKVGQEMIKVNSLMNEYLMSNNPETWEQIEGILQSLPETPASQTKTMEILGMFAENVPQMAVNFAQSGTVSMATTAALALGLALAPGGKLGALTLGGATGLTLASQAGMFAGLTKSAFFSKEQMTGSFALSLYQELKDMGVENPDLDKIKPFALAVGSGMSVVESASFGSMAKTIPGMEKVFGSMMKKHVVDYITGSGRKNILTSLLKKPAAAAVARGGAAYASKALPAIAENAGEEALQEVIASIGRGVYRSAYSINRISRDKARMELRSQGIYTPTAEQVTEYIDKVEKEERKISKKSANELKNEYLESAIAGALFGGAFGFAGSSVSGLREGSAEYKAQRAHVEQVVHDIVTQEGITADEIFTQIRESDELKMAMGKKELQKRAEQGRDFKADLELEKIREKRDWGDREVYHKDPNGFYYDTDGNPVRREEMPNEPDVVEWGYDENGIYKNLETGESWFMPPWVEKLGEVHEDPNTGEFVDRYTGERYKQEDIPVGYEAHRYTQDKYGRVFDEEGEQVAGFGEKLPWEWDYTEFKEKDALRRTKGQLTDEQRKQRAATIFVSDAEARIRYNQAVLDARKEGNPLQMDYLEWVDRSNLTITQDKARLMAVDTETDIRNYRHVINQAKTFLYQLQGAHREPFKQAVDKMSTYIKELDEGQRDVLTFTEALKETEAETDRIREELAKLRTLEKNAKDKNVRAKLHNEIEGLRNEITKLNIGNRMFKRFFEQTHMNQFAYKWQLLRQQEHLENFAAHIQDLKDPENIRYYNGRAAIEEIFENIDEESSPNDIILASLEKVQEGLIPEVKKAHSEYMRAVSTVRRMEKANQERAMRYVSKKIASIMKTPSRTIHRTQRRAILAMQQMIDPNWRNKATLLDWKDQWNDAVGNIRRAGGDMEAVKEAISVLKKPLNRWTIEEVQAIDYAVNMLTEVGRVQREMEVMESRAQRQGIIDLAIDGAKGIDAQTVIENYGKENFKDLTGKKKKHGVLGLISKYLVPEQVFDALDGFMDYKGPIVEFFVDRRHRAQAEKLKNISSRHETIHNWMAENDYKQSRVMKEIQVMDRTFEVQDIFTFYAALGKEGRHSGNEILANRLRDNMGMNQELMQRAIATLSEKDLDFADMIMADYRENFDRINDTYMRETNTDLVEEINYIPIVYEWMLEQADKVEYGDIIYDQITRGQYQEKKVQDSMTKTRTEELGDKQSVLKLGMFDVWNNMVEKQEHYINYATLANDMKRVSKNKDFRSAVSAKLGAEWLKTIDSYVEAQVSPYGWRGFSAVDKILREVKHRSMIGFLAYNGKTMLKQIPSLSFYFKYAGPKYMLSAIAELATNRGKFLQEVGELDPMFKSRGFALENMDWRKEFKGDWKSKKHKIGDLGMKGIQLMDHMVVGAGTKAVYQMMRDAGHSEQTALDYSRKVMNISQPNADPGALPAMWRTNESIRLSLAFGQQITKIWDMLGYETVANLKNKQFNEAFNNILSIQISTFMVMLASHMRMPEDEQEFAQWMLFGNLNYVPHVGRMLVAMSQGYDASDLLTNDIKEGKEIGTKMFKALFDGDTTAYEQAKSIFDRNLPGLGALTGLPGVAVDNIYDAFAEGDIRELVGGVSER